jgi:hypothetical protein
MAKMAVLKPIMWNDKGYTCPAGCPSTSGYSHLHGYGHEEWNNNPKWVWQGWKVFHTEASERLRKAALHGDLGMVMIASHGGVAYALGVATNVYVNDRKDMKRIVDAVGKNEDMAAVWALRTVQRGFLGKQGAFRMHWRKEIPWVQWRCLPEHFYWFRAPIPLDPQRATGKKRLAMHHGRFKETTPAVLFDIIDVHLPKDRKAIREWLSSESFDQPRERRTASQKAGSRILSRVRRGSNAPTDRRFEYWVRGNRSVEPLHHRLQELFIQHLKAKGINPALNVDYVDVQYEAAEVTTFCEVKPTDNVETRYAIRAAIGQLLEYRYVRHLPTAAVEIVLGSRPSDDEIGFVKSLTIGLTYYDSASGRFVSV